MLFRRFSLLALCLVCASCEEDSLAEARRLQADIRRAIITTKSLGRFGALALFQEDVGAMPCTPPLSDSQRLCEVKVQGRGNVKVGLASPALSDAGRVQRDAVLWIRYPADCADQKFDFKSIDNALPRLPGATATSADWQDKLVRASWRKQGERCSMLVAVSPALMARLTAELALDGGAGPEPE